MFWKKRPITHAVGLWLLVAAAAVGLVALVSYASSVAGVKKDRGPSPPASADAPVRAEHPPTLYGTVVTFDGTVLRVDSKQPFDEVIIASGTKITTVGGSEVPSSALVTGAVVTATGKDLGDRRLSAAAVVILGDR